MTDKPNSLFSSANPAASAANSEDDRLAPNRRGGEPDSAGGAETASDQVIWGIRQVANYLSLTPRTTRRVMRRGGIQTVQIPGLRKVGARRDHLDSLLQSGGKRRGAA